MRLPLTTLSIGLVACTAFAAEVTEADKSQYWLGNPTPRDLMRPITSDATWFLSPITPYTVDAGHVQFENSLAFAYLSEEQKSGSWRQEFTHEALVWHPSLRVGLCNWSDLKVQAAYWDQRDRVDASSYRFVNRYAFWDAVNFSLKANLIGNDGGRFAAAIEPFYTFGLEFERDEFGINAPVSFGLTETTWLNITPRLRFYDFSQGNYMQFHGTVQLRQTVPCCNKLDLFAQFNGFWTDERRYWSGYAGGGAAYRFTRDIELQLGSDFGVIDSGRLIEDFIVSGALTVRF